MLARYSALYLYSVVKTLYENYDKSVRRFAFGVFLCGAPLRSTPYYARRIHLSCISRKYAANRVRFPKSVVFGGAVDYFNRANSLFPRKPFGKSGKKAKAWVCLFQVIIIAGLPRAGANRLTNSAVSAIIPCGRFSENTT